MNKYYDIFLNYNNKLMIDLFDSFEKHNIFKKIKFNYYSDNKNIFIEKVNIGNGYYAEMKVEKFDFTINIKLKNYEIDFYFNKGEVYNDNMSFEDFKKKYYIKINKKKPENSKASKIIYFISKDYSAITYSMKDKSLSSVLPKTLASFSNGDIVDIIKNKQVDNLILNSKNTSFFISLRSIPNFKDISEEITDFIFIGKEISKETKDLINLSSDITPEMIAGCKELLFNIKDVNEEIYKLRTTPKWNIK